jgi:hypothetical protein
VIPSTPIFSPAAAHLVDGVLDRSQHRTHRDDDGFGILGQIRMRQATRLATEYRLELLGQLRDQFESLHLLGVRQVAHLRESLRADHRADRHRLPRVKHLARFVRRQEGVDLLLVGTSTRS